MAEIEFEITGFFEPCRSSDWTRGGPMLCLNTVRAIRHVPANMGKKLVCGNGHNQRPNSAFIPGHEFDEGGEYYGIVPREFLPSNQSMRDSRWKIPADAAINDVECDACVICGVPTFDFYGGPDIGHAFPWLQLHAPNLVERIRAAVRLHAGASLVDWPGLVDDDLKRRIRERLDMSRLEIDHAVPRKVGNELWQLLTPAERRILQVTLLIKACKSCNLTKAKKLVERDLIESWYVILYCDGDRSAAIADQPRWGLIDRTLTKIFEQRSIG